MVGDLEVAWFCAYTPLEILQAAGLLPSRRMGEPDSSEAADALLHTTICPYVRACLAEALERKEPQHAVFVNSCDAMRRLHDAWKEAFPRSFVHLMDLPRRTDERGRRFLAREYRRLAEALGSFLGREITAGALEESCAEVEEWRLSYLREAEGLAGSRRLRLAQEYQSDPTGKGTAKWGAGEALGGVPVLLTGNLLNPQGLVSVLDQAGARTVWLDLCNGDRAFSSSTRAEGGDMEELLLSLAGRYLERHPCARMQDAGLRYQSLLERVKATGARGVVFASLKFCDSYLYDFPRLRDRLQGEGIPCLRLESDYADGHAGQLLTRVEAFLEMIS